MHEGITYVVRGPHAFLKYDAKTGKQVHAFVIEWAYRRDNDPMDYLWLGAGEYDGDRMYPVDIEDTYTDPDSGDITFSAFDGNYCIRALRPSDGIWCGRKFRMPLPMRVLEEFHTPQPFADGAWPEGRFEESLTAFAVGKRITALVYDCGGVGRYFRFADEWAQIVDLPPVGSEPSAFAIDPLNAARVVAAFDAGQLTTDNI